MLILYIISLNGRDEAAWKTSHARDGEGNLARVWFSQESVGLNVNWPPTVECNSNDVYFRTIQVYNYWHMGYLINDKRNDGHRDKHAQGRAHQGSSPPALPWGKLNDDEIQPSARWKGAISEGGQSNLTFKQKISLMFSFTLFTVSMKIKEKKSRFSYLLI